MWTFAEAETYLNDTAPQGKSVYGLGRIVHLLELMDHPEREFRCVTVVGTNGKGSTLAFLDSLLLAHGVKTACHIKPHLESVTERIRINGIDSTEEEFAETLWEVKQEVDKKWSRDDRPTYFELLFAACLNSARKGRVDVALLETGLGGRLDAVNSVGANPVILTSVGYDHTDLLGDTLTEIAKEKIVVARPGSTLLCQENPEEVMKVVRGYTTENSIRVVMPERNKFTLDESSNSYTWESESFGKIEGILPGLKGTYQRTNAALSLRAFEEISEKIYPGLLKVKPNADSIVTGMKNARLPGRWEKLQVGNGDASVILDGAHNPDGLSLALNEWRNESGGLGTIIFGMKQTKDVQKIIPSLLKSSGRIIFTPVPDLECYNPHDLETMAVREAIEGGLSQISLGAADSIEEGLKMALNGPNESGPVLVTGSLYLVGAARRIIRNGPIL